MCCENTQFISHPFSFWFVVDAFLYTLFLLKYRYKCGFVVAPIISMWAIAKTSRTFFFLSLFYVSAPSFCMSLSLCPGQRADSVSVFVKGTLLDVCVLLPQICAHVLRQRKCHYIGNCSFAHSQEERDVWTYMKNEGCEHLFYLLRVYAHCSQCLRQFPSTTVFLS